jgi:hypothetical protein
MPHTLQILMIVARDVYCVIFLTVSGASWVLSGIYYF